MHKPGDSLWVELVGDIIIARVRGAVTEQVVVECQEQVVRIQQDTGCTKVLYDALEVDRPSVQAALRQQTLTKELSKSATRTAIVVSNSSVAYLARIAFGEGDHRVFYNDLGAALRWLSET